MRIQKSTLFFSQLINLRQKGSMMEHIEDFQKLNIRVKDIPKEHKIDLFIGTLKDNIQHEVHLWEPVIGEGIQVGKKNGKQTYGNKEAYTHNHKDGSITTPSHPQPTRLAPQQLEEKISKGIFYSCDSKYSKVHKCSEKKLFYIDCDEEEKKEQETSKEEDIHQEQTL